METICEAVRGKRFFVTGATGLIGQNVVKYLRENGAEVLALTRREIAEAPFLLGDVTALPDVPGEIDYIIHGASATASAFFVQHPAETIDIAVQGTKNVLELARKKNVKGLVYLSSMEVYGTGRADAPVAETDTAAFDPAAARNCYPLSKLLCEALCCAYATEYGVSAKIIRLCQTFGLEMKRDDRRLFAELIRCAAEGRDIVLHTAGETAHCYLCTDDATQAILTVLLRGSAGEAYTAADEASFASVAQLSEAVAREYGIHVRYDVPAQRDTRYPDTHTLRLSAEKLRALGWAPQYTFSDAFRRVAEAWSHP